MEHVDLTKDAKLSKLQNNHLLMGPLIKTNQSFRSGFFVRKKISIKKVFCGILDKIAEYDWTEEAIIDGSLDKMCPVRGLSLPVPKIMRL